jgi:hypothetical protein
MARGSQPSHGQTRKRTRFANTCHSACAPAPCVGTDTARTLDTRARARLLCAESDGADWRTAGFQVNCVPAGRKVDAYVLRMNRRPFNRAKGKDLKMVRSDDPAYLLGHSWKTREAALHPRNVRSFRYWVTYHSFKAGRRGVCAPTSAGDNRCTTSKQQSAPSGQRAILATLLS